ncbi:MAG: AAA family ATPase, partial [Chlamydiae bacterium]|nr:AAA family ATPase [Chlamydiota bacterium]
MTAWLDQFFAEKMIQRFKGGDEAFLIELMRSAREGHLCIERKDPLEESPHGMICEAAADMSTFPEAPVIKMNQRYYLQRNWVYETHICRQIARLLSASRERVVAPSALLSNALAENILLPAQAKAIEHVLHHPLTVISGGPGTGKTYTAGHLIQTLAKSFEVKRLYKVCLTAPTGKAAQHLQSALCAGDLPLSLRTETLHRLLRLAPGRPRLFNPVVIDADLIIVDEASMIDVDLWAHLLEAVSSRTKLVLMGDPGQLPPVEAGSICSDLSDLFATHLDQCMRTDNTKLRELSLSIQKGSLAEVKQLLENGLGT